MGARRGQERSFAGVAAPARNGADYTREARQERARGKADGALDPRPGGQGY